MSWYITPEERAIINHTGMSIRAKSENECFKDITRKEIIKIKSKIGNIENTINNMLKTTNDILKTIEQMEKQRRKIDEELNTKLQEIKDKSWYNYFGIKI